MPTQYELRQLFYAEYTRETGKPGDYRPLLFWTGAKIRLSVSTLPAVSGGGIRMERVEK